VSCKHPEAGVLCLGHLLMPAKSPLFWCGWCGAIRRGWDGKWSKPALTKATRTDRQSKATR
jgi:hypothetical protein